MLSEPLSMAFNCFYFFTCFVFLLPQQTPLLAATTGTRTPNFEVLDSYFILFLSPRFLYGMIHEGHVPLLPNFYSKETWPSNLNKVTNTWMAPPSRQPIFLSDQKIQPATFQNKISKSSFNTLPRCHLSRVTQR